MLQKLQNKPIVGIILLVLCMLGFHLDTLQISIMEARNFITAREMITDNNWLLTTMNGEARYQKPPLPSWICACFAILFGIKNIMAYRLPAIIFIAITGVYSYLMSKQLTNCKMQSMHTALILITSFYIIGIAFEAPSDIITHGFMLIGVYQLFILFQNNTNYLKHSLIAGFFIGCSILSKGPVSFYVLLLPFLLAYGFSFKYKFNKRLVFSFLFCLVIALIIGGSWYLYVRIYDAQTFTAIAERETGNWTRYNVRPFYYYWSFFTQSGIWTIPAFIGLLYPYLKSRVSNLKAYKFSFYWTIFAVILLSIIPEKKSRYLMPVLIPLAINTGFYIDYLIRHFKNLKDKRETIPVYFNFTLIALIALAFPVVAYLLLKAQINGFWLWYILASLISLALGLGILFQLKKKNINHVFEFTILFFVSLLVFALPLQDAFASDNFRPISELKSKLDSQHIKVYGFNYISPEMIWEYGDKILPIKNGDAYQFPKEKKFGMLADAISTEDRDFIETLYQIEELETFDLNEMGLDSRSYNDRLRNHFYMLTKY